MDYTTTAFRHSHACLLERISIYVYLSVYLYIHVCVHLSKLKCACLSNTCVRMCILSRTSAYSGIHLWTHDCHGHRNIRMVIQHAHVRTNISHSLRPRNTHRLYTAMPPVYPHPPKSHALVCTHRSASVAATKSFRVYACLSICSYIYMRVRAYIHTNTRAKGSWKFYGHVFPCTSVPGLDPSIMTRAFHSCGLFFFSFALLRLRDIPRCSLVMLCVCILHLGSAAYLALWVCEHIFVNTSNTECMRVSTAWGLRQQV